MTRHARVAMSAELYERVLALAGGSRLKARLMFESALERIVRDEERRARAAARAGEAHMRNPRRRWGLTWAP